MDGNVQTATLVETGLTVTFSVASVTRPRVPSDPMKSLVRSYPAELFRGRCLVLMIVPSAMTTVKLRTHSRIVPYLYAFVPLHPVPTMPPIIAPGPGSGGKNR